MKRVILGALLVVLIGLMNCSQQQTAKTESQLAADCKVLAKIRIWEQTNNLLPTPDSDRGKLEMSQDFVCAALEKDGGL